MAFNKEKVMDAARKFVDKGQLDKAVKEYLRIVREDPRDVRVWLKIGDLYAKKGSKQEAIETYLRVAQFYHEQGFFLKAVAVYKQILKLDPRLVEVNLKLADLYRQLGLLSDAMQHFEAVAAHFHREGNTRDALAAVQKLVDLDPENIATRIKLAELYSKEGMNAEAVAAFGVACEQLRRQGRQDEFIKVAERLLFHQPNNHQLNRELAALYLHRNDPRRALHKLQVTFKADPRDVDTLALLASAFQALDQKQKTVSVFKELARIHQDNKALDKAGEVFRRVLELAPNDADAVAFLGEHASREPQVQERPRLQFTNEVPAIGQRQPTGSMPLVQDHEISAVDFELPDYDDSDFSEELERGAHDVRANSAEGELHAEEIAKTLAESDVYVKYGLHQKAIDHLRRVFAYDPHNVEARERLKDILISLGRASEAETELFALAELVAPESPERAELYLRELIGISPSHAGAFELARRYRLRIGRLASEMSSGGSLGYDQLEYSGGREPADSIDDFDPHELIGAAHGSPAPGRPPGRPPFGGEDFGETPSQTTRQLSASQAMELLGHAARAGGDLDDEPGTWRAGGSNPPSPALAGRSVARTVPSRSAISPLPSRASGGARLEVRPSDAGFEVDLESSFAELLEPRPAAPEASFDEAHAEASIDSALESALDASLESQLDDAALELDLRGGYQGGGLLPEDMPFDPHEAREFDAAVARAPFDPYGEDQETPVEDQAGSLSLDTAAVDIGELEGHGGEDLEEALEHAELYASQQMVQEALEIVRSLAERYPDHPLILSKLRDLEGASYLELVPSAEDVGGTEAIEIDDIEEVGDDEIGEVEQPTMHEPDDLDPVPMRKQRAPSVMLEKPVDDADADTHYDLGLAYKEMGLYHEAIKAFDKARRGSKEVQSRLMIGICYREMGNSSEAVHQFKLGLHAVSISDRERQSLYYEIGATYEGMNDTSEALYYFEMVVKRDPAFADAARRVESMRASPRRST